MSSHSIGYTTGVTNHLDDRSVRSVVIDINLSAIRDNLATARRLSGGSLQFATIKADAYGHGAVCVAQALSGQIVETDTIESNLSENVSDGGRADGFAVVTTDEALELRVAGIEQPILVLQGPQNADVCAEFVRHRLWPVIHDFGQYQWYKQYAERHQLLAWLKIDTGMGRLGVSPVQAEKILTADDGINWHGILTHFACADEVSNAFTTQQIDVFSRVVPSHRMLRSMANSSAILAWPQSRADWARPGIMLYGCNPLNTNLPDGVSLTPAMTVKAPLISVKQMPEGSSIGYACAYRCPEDMPVGYVALGYRDGIPRVLDSKAEATVKEHRCSIIGRVSMDSFAVDLRKVPSAHVGEMVELWGENASIDALAGSAGTISYELLTSIRGHRRYHFSL